MYYFVKYFFDTVCSIFSAIVFALPFETLNALVSARIKTTSNLYLQKLKFLYYKADEAGCRFYYPAAQIQKATGNNILLA